MVSPLDGAWVLSDLRCSNSAITEAGKQERDDIRKGIYKNLTTVTGDEVNIFIINLPSEPGKHPNSRCEMRLREQWLIDSNQSTITVSSTEARSRAVNVSPNTKGCPDSFKIEKIRTHKFEIKDDLLLVTLSESFSTTGAVSRSACGLEQGTLVYKRVF